MTNPTENNSPKGNSRLAKARTNYFKEDGKEKK